MVVESLSIDYQTLSMVRTDDNYVEIHVQRMSSHISFYNFLLFHYFLFGSTTNPVFSLGTFQSCYIYHAKTLS